LIDHYEKLDRHASPESHHGIQYLLALYRLDHRQARKPMLTALDRVADSKYADRLRRYLRREAQAYSVGLGPEATRGPSRSSTHGLHGEQPFRDAAPIALEEKHAGLYYFEPFTAHPEMVEELHEMRIAAKWLRYTMELFAPAYADGLKESLSAVKKIQELLGDLHDSDVRLDRLAAVLAEPLDARGMEPLGIFLPEPVVASLRSVQADEQRERNQCYKAFYKEWKKLDKAGFKAGSLERIRRPDA
jgi:CHAD domain-containing protein